MAGSGEERSRAARKVDLRFPDGEVNADRLSEEPIGEEALGTGTTTSRESGAGRATRSGEGIPSALTECGAAGAIISAT